MGIKAEDFPQERALCEVWTRAMGYHRPVSAFNQGKQSAHLERRFFVGRNDQLCRSGT